MFPPPVRDDQVAVMGFTKLLASFLMATLPMLDLACASCTWRRKGERGERNERMKGGIGLCLPSSEHRVIS